MATTIRVDNMRGITRWAVEAYGWVVAAATFVVFGALRATLTIRHHGRPADGSAIIACAWHEHLPTYFLCCLPVRTPTAWMNHPAWYMRPIHRLLGWYGVGTLFFGSSGNNGRAALAGLAGAVARGASTFINPDGPHGPSHVVKDGVVELGRVTRRPVVALTFRCGRPMRLPTWDRKVVPLPFSSVDVTWHPPLTVDPADVDTARANIAAALDGGAAPRPAPGPAGPGTSA